MTDIEKKLAFLLSTSPYLDTLDDKYEEAARDLVANGVTVLQPTCNQLATETDAGRKE